MWFFALNGVSYVIYTLVSGGSDILCRIASPAQLPDRRPGHRGRLWRPALDRDTQPRSGVAWPLRRALETNEQLARDYFRPTRVAREFPSGTSSMPKVNGVVGIDNDDFKYSHGAPLRLAISIKYGIKNLKCVGRLSFTKSRPPDFWAERGYDDYAGF
jgi:hypothetical protein